MQHIRKLGARIRSGFEDQVGDVRRGPVMECLGREFRLHFKCDEVMEHFLEGRGIT